MAADKPAALTRRAITLRLALGALGAAVLIAAGVGAYLSLVPAPEDRSAGTQQPPEGFPFRLHAAPQTLPNIAFEDGAGRKLTLADFRGKVVLLNVWATWCPPCRREMPALDRLQQQLGGPGFEVVALSIDSDGLPAVREFYLETGVSNLGIYVDKPMKATSTLGATGLPTTLLINAQGREIGRKLGPAEWDSPEVVATIRQYLGPSL
ncbi:MAG: TlpA family protein disulfide reductase [Betaproteobacteria bacterium]|nr:TlpA family protein disulfide reductase [Betaproteobacteria bacterium]MBI2509759.1 TlpA family protein disulfide reductase [Betaproteobacteria bacterium]